MLSKWPQKDPEEIFLKQEKMGSGSFGSVYKGINKHTSEPVAIKIIDFETVDDAIGDIKEEMGNVSLCDNPFVSKHQGGYERDNKLWIIMEYLAGSLLDLMKAGPLEEPCIAVILRDLLQGLKHLHQEGKVHGDIKPANIFFNNHGEVKLSDFGVPQKMLMKRRTVMSAPYCMAPEVIKQTVYDSKADIWSTGILSIFMARNQLPYSDLHYMRALFLIPKNPPPVLEGGYTKSFKEFVSLCLKKDPLERLSAKELLDHPFIKTAPKNSLIIKQRLPASPPSSKHSQLQKIIPPLKPLPSIASLKTPITPNPSSPSSSSQRSSALTLVIYPVLSKLLKTNQEESTVISMLTQLKIAFDTAEHARPGITHTIIAQIIQALKK